jgi:hypothetical protein
VDQVVPLEQDPHAGVGKALVVEHLDGRREQELRHGHVGSLARGPTPNLSSPLTPGRM